MSTPTTPFARWRELGEPDPFGSQYQRGRELAYGHISDAALAGGLNTGIGMLTAGKERIRWLSRRLYSLSEDPDVYGPRRAELRSGELTDDELANAFFLHETPYLEAARERIRWLSEEITKIEVNKNA